MTRDSARRRLATLAASLLAFCLAMAVAIAGPELLGDQRGGATTRSFAAQPSPSPSLSGPVTVALVGQSTYAGRPDVNGTATVSLEDGSVVVQALGLPQLPADHAYVVWLVNSQDGTVMSVGPLQPAGAMGAYAGNFGAGRSLVDGHFDAVMITDEPGGMMMIMADHFAGEIVLAGFFPGMAPGPLPSPMPQASPSPGARFPWGTAG